MASTIKLRGENPLRNHIVSRYPFGYIKEICLECKFFTFPKPECFG